MLNRSRRDDRCGGSSDAKVRERLFQGICAEFDDLEIDGGQPRVEHAADGRLMVLVLRRGASGNDSAIGELLALSQENGSLLPQHRDLVDISCHRRLLSGFSGQCRPMAMNLA